MSAGEMIQMARMADATTRTQEFHTFDEYGNHVTRYQCQRCLAVIKYPYWYRGQCYGSECIEVVTGQRVDRWVVRDRVIDEQATAERDRQRDEQRAALRAQADARSAARQARVVEFAWLSNALGAQVRWIQPAAQYCEPGYATILGVSEFACSLLEQLFDGGPDGLSGCQTECLADLYAREFGRRNSKAHGAALDEFWAKWSEHLDEEGS